jgi:hypothetical protein
VYPENLDGVGARSAQDLAKTSTDRKSIRTQATIFKKPVFLILK